MIVIAIISILTVVLYPPTSAYLARGRDSTRVTDIAQISKSLNTYATEHGGVYPPHESGCVPTTWLVPAYIARVPTSPSGSSYDEWCGSNGRYGYAQSGMRYMLIANMESPSGGNYSGSTTWFTGTLTQQAVDNSSTLTKGLWARYVASGWGSTTILANIPPPPPPPPPPPGTLVDGVCDNSTQFACTAGTAGATVPGAYGGSSTWTCFGANGGLSPTDCTHPNPYLVTWDHNYTWAPLASSSTVSQNTPIWSDYPVDPIRTTYTFNGWYDTAATTGTAITPTTVVNANITYYARWISSNPYAVCTSAWQTATASSTYPGCSQADKIICTGSATGYTWAMCNVGSTTAGTWPASYGSLFQWWRNHPFPSTGTVPTLAWPIALTWLAAADSADQFITNWSLSPNDWLNTQDDNRWGWEATATMGTYQTVSPANQALMQWPCSPGYHVPTYQEADDTIRVGLSNSIGQSNTALMPPFAGYRSVADGTYGGYLYSQSISGFWWLSSSSPPGFSPSRGVYWDSSDVFSNYDDIRAYGFSVRCLRN